MQRQRLSHGAGGWVGCCWRVSQTSIACSSCSTSSGGADGAGESVLSDDNGCCKSGAGPAAGAAPYSGIVTVVRPPSRLLALPPPSVRPSGARRRPPPPIFSVWRRPRLHARRGVQVHDLVYTCTPNRRGADRSATPSPSKCGHCSSRWRHKIRNTSSLYGLLFTANNLLILTLTPFPNRTLLKYPT